MQMMVPNPENAALASKLREIAELLDAQGADGFRIAAYRRAASKIDAMTMPVTEIVSREGQAGLVALPAIGTGIAAALAEMVLTGRWAQLERLRGEAVPEKLFISLPGIGPELATAIAEHLDVDTLQALEVAAHDGRLEMVPGIGRRRAAAIRACLAERLRRPPMARPAEPAIRPDVATLLDVDREYREKGEAGRLKTIAPRRFNPEGRAWLPILHTNRGAWAFTVLYSNTARAHELGKTTDWVVIFFHRGVEPEQQCTVVTAGIGPHKGQRVVRGREDELAAWPARGNVDRHQ